MSRRINEIVLGKRDITSDTDLRLARYFGVSEGLFLGLQMDYDLMQRRREIDRGPMALEIQHSSDVILQRVNRFFGWSAVGRLALRQAPLSRRHRPRRPRAPEPEAVAEVANTLSAVEDEDLRAALARLGASIKRN